MCVSIVSAPDNGLHGMGGRVVICNRMEQDYQEQLCCMQAMTDLHYVFDGCYIQCILEARVQLLEVVKAWEHLTIRPV